MRKNALRIGIDISSLLNHGPDIGAGRYILNLVKALITEDKKNTYVLTGRYETKEYLNIINNLIEEFNGRVDLKLTKTSHKKLELWDKLRFPPLELTGFSADIFHCPDYLVPPTLNKNIIITIHDLSFLRYPQFNFDWFIKKYTGLVRKNALRAKRIIADSYSTKNDIVRFFEINPDKIEVIYLAAESIFKKLDDNEKDTNSLIKHGIDRKYILSVGTIEPRKNFITLIKAFNLIKENEAAADLKLVIAGRTGWKSEDTYAERGKSPYLKDILFTGRVPDSDLIQIYNQAEIFVYPSIFEGFGLPPLEAMSCGLPVIVSDTSSLKEVIGDSGILVKVGDEHELARNILDVLKNKELKERLIKKSLLNAKKFSWANTAKKTFELYYKTNLH